MSQSILKLFLSQLRIEDCLKAYPFEENGLSEIVIGEVSFLYGNKGLIAYTPDDTFEWECNCYNGVDYVFQEV